MFTTKQVETKTLGEYLLASRNRSHLSIGEAAKFSQVQPKYILALEEGRFKDLPAQVYVKGFLRSLARIYRIDSSSVTQQFENELEISRNAQLLIESSPKPRFVFPHFVFSPKTLTISGLVILGLVSFGYLYFQISSLKRPPSLKIFSPIADGTVDSSLVQVRGKTEPGASVTLNNQPIVVDASGEFGENISLGPGANQLVIKAKNKFGQETTQTHSLVYQEKNIAGSFTTNQTDAANVSLEILVGPGAAWVDVNADGKQVYSGTMLAGARQKFTALDKILLSTGNAGSTRVFLNGKDLGVLGKEKEVLREIEFGK
jgi:cytoskeletal protein RodZ